MALTKDREVNFYVSTERVLAPVDDNVTIYKNGFVGRNRATGLARPLVLGDDFLGLAFAQADNTVAGHTAGGINVELHQNIDIIHVLAGALQADVGKDVYATADDTLTLAPLSASRIGRIVALESAGVVRVRCTPIAAQIGAQENELVVLLADESVTLTLDQVNRVLLMGNTLPRTVTLPSIASVRPGGWVQVIKTSAAAAAITLDGSGAETIDGATTLATIDARYDAALLVNTGSEWIVLNRDIS